MASPGNTTCRRSTCRILARALKGMPADEAAPEHRHQARPASCGERPSTRALPFGVQPHDLAKAGWGIVFHKDEAPAVRQALQPLVEHRRRRSATTRA